MLKQILYIILFLNITLLISAQTLTGIVYDQNLNEPVWNANVYFDATSLHTITDKEGRFELKTDKDIAANLVISFVGYEKVIFNPPFTTIPDTIFLKEKPAELAEVVVRAKEGGYTRARKLKAFRNQFLGTSKAGKSCKILNEEDIKLIYDSRNKVLIASANMPIIVENKYLGYTIHFDLAEFRVQYNNNSLDDMNMLKTSILGTTSYQDISKKKKKIQENRRVVYDKSISNFIRNLYNNTLDKSNFRLLKGGDWLILEDCFTITKEDESHYKVTIIPRIFELGDIVIIYDKKQMFSSRMNFHTNEFWINSSQITAPLNGEISFSGDMGDQRIGDLLPTDYKP
ncbi:carboxypeptidase-like regulatory domain-containing protein [Parabacteroides sp. OttesenSCG-928-G21]|nr:carboxypeptidase-like regulatory domain-containing protein [Parabacteroides sp. OttesenSCG-928-G21]